MIKDSDLINGLGRRTELELRAIKGDLLNLQNGGYIADQQKIGDQINTWLLEHPEITTTVQDKAISERKLTDELLKRINPDKLDVVIEKNDVKTTSKDYVYVQEMNVLYKKESWTDGGIYRNNGTRVFAVPDTKTIINACNSINRVLLTAATYFSGRNLVYGNYNTLFHEETTNKIDCSSFVSAVIQDIKYENSKYNANDNIFGENCATVLPDGDDRYNSLRTHNMAHYFAEKGYLHKIADVSYLCVGDVLFGTSVESDAKANRYYGIGHCAIVIGVYPESGYVQVIQAGSFDTRCVISGQLSGDTINTQIINVKDYIGDVFKVFARVPFGNCEKEPVNMVPLHLMPKTKSCPVGYTTFLNIKTHIKKRCYYTIRLKGNFPQSGYPFIRCLGGDGDVTVCSLNKFTFSNELVFNFVAQKNNDTITIQWNNNTSSEITININSVEIMEGYGNGIEMSPVDIVSDYLVNNSNYSVKYGNKIHLHFDVNMPDAESHILCTIPGYNKSFYVPLGNTSGAISRVSNDGKIAISGKSGTTTIDGILDY